jgi:hypothetical protein
MPIPTQIPASISATGKLSSKFAKGTRFNSVQLIRKLVQFDLAKLQGAGIADVDIARILNRSVYSLARIRTKLDYLKIRTETTTGIPAGGYEYVNMSLAQRREMLRDAVPSALRVMVDILENKPSDTLGRRLQVEIAKEVLDREGTLAKVSKAEIHATHSHDYASIDGVSKELLDAMGGSTENLLETVNEIVRTNEKFSNSETLSAQEQEAALAKLDETNSTIQ